MILAVVGTKHELPGLRKYVHHIIFLIHQKYPDLRLVSGGCRGVDLYAAEYALEHGVEITVFLPSTIEHNPYGDATIPLLRKLPQEWVIEQPQYADVDMRKKFHPFFERNRKIAEYCTHAIAFPLEGDSRGTLYTVNYAKKLERPVKVYWIRKK